MLLQSSRLCETWNAAAQPKVTADLPLLRPCVPPHKGEGGVNRCKNERLVVRTMKREQQKVKRDKAKGEVLWLYRSPELIRYGSLLNLTGSYDSGNNSDAAPWGGYTRGSEFAPYEQPRLDRSK